MSLAPRLRRLTLAATLLSPLALPLPAAAQSPPAPSADGARALAGSLREWLARQLAGIADTANLPLVLVAEDDTYRLEVPLGGAYADGNVVIAPAALTATVRPLEAGRWAIVSGAMPAVLEADLRNTSGGAPARMTLSIESQQNSGTLDPTLASRSDFHTVISGYATEMKTAAGTQSSRIASITGRSEWLPSGPGRVTIQGDSMLEGYATASPLPGGAEAKVTIDRLTGTTRIENFNIEGFPDLLRTAFALGTAAKAGKPESAAPRASSPEEKAATLKLIGQLVGMLDALDANYAYDNIKVDGGALFSGSLRRFGMGFSLGAPDGRTDARLKLSLEGLESPMIPPGPWVEFIPHQVGFTTRAGGVPKEALLALLRRAVETDAKGIDADALALIAAYPVRLAIEDLLIDLGPLRLKGEGSMDVSNLADATGEAELRATGLDALIRRANAIPELKLAAPVLIFLKGIGRQDGNEVVWNISYDAGRVMVNDTDLSDLMPAR